MTSYEVVFQKESRQDELGELGHYTSDQPFGTISVGDLLPNVGPMTSETWRVKQIRHHFTQEEGNVHHKIECIMEVTPGR